MTVPATPAWFDLAPGPEVPTTVPTAPVSADVVVVGLGASGLTACVELVRRGADVVGLDTVGIAGGAAGANGGFLLAGLAMFHHDAVRQLGRRRAARAYAWTVQALLELYEVEPTARRTGSLRVAVDDAEATDVDDQRRALVADGFHAEPSGDRGLVVPTDGVVHPVARCRRLAADAATAGARLLAPVRATAAAPGTVETAEGVPITAAHVLVAVDGGLEDLVPDVGVRSARLQMLATGPAPMQRHQPEYRRWGYDYLQQLPTGEVLLGGGRDVGGTDEWGAPAVPSAAVQAHLDALLHHLGVDAPVTHRWAARAGFTDDLLPVCTTVADGLHLVGGYSGHGNVIGPALARRAAAAVLDGDGLALPF